MGMRTHRRASKARIPAPQIIDVEMPPDLADDPPMTTLPDTGVQPIVEDVILVADDDPDDREITRPYPRVASLAVMQAGPPRH